METDLGSVAQVQERATTARPILLVHGAWHDSSCWDRNFVPYMTVQGREVHTVNLRGHGDRPAGKSLRRLRIRDYVADVAEAAAAIDQAPVIVGHSMGGFVVQNYLQRYPAPGVVLISSVPPRGAWGATFRTLRRFPIPFIKVNLTWRMYPLVCTMGRARALLFSAATPDETVEWCFQRLQDESYFAYWDMLLFARPNPKKVHVPLLAIGGTDDALFTPRDVGTIARVYEGRAEILPATGHDVMLEPHWQDAADMILRWLDDRGL